MRRDVVGAGLLVLVLVALLPLGVVAVLLATAAPATATSCAEAPVPTPHAIADGTYRLGPEGETPFRDVYPGAVIGTVREVRSPGDLGPVDVVVEVTASLGPDVGGEVVITQGDTGGMVGHPFVVGEHYLVPYTTPDGVPYAFVCDPAFATPQDGVQDVVDAAQEGAWPGEARMAGTGTDGPADDEVPASDVPGLIGVSGVPGVDVLVTGALLAVVLAVAAVVVVRLRRRYGGGAPEGTEHHGGVTSLRA